MLELRNLSFSASDDVSSESDSSPKVKEIIKNLNIKIDSGKIIAITGPNGGGKSTLAKLIAGIETPNNGQIILDGKDITNLDVTERAKLGISFGFQRPVCFKGFTVRDILNVAANRELTDKELKGLLSEVGLCMRDYADREIGGRLSGGEQKRIEIAGVLARNTSMNIFDEPEAGIDIWSFQRLIGVFCDLRKDPSKTQIIITHQRGILEIADEILVLSGGEIINRGVPEKLISELFANGGAKCPMSEHCEMGRI